jgi:hypothetical protein
VSGPAARLATLAAAALHEERSGARQVRVGGRGVNREALVDFYRARRGRGGEGWEQWPSLPWRAAGLELLIAIKGGALIEMKQKRLMGGGGGGALGLLDGRLEGGGEWWTRGKRSAGTAVENMGGARGRGWCRQVGPVGQ